MGWALPLTCGLLAAMGSSAQQRSATAQAASADPFGTVITQGAYDGGLDTRSLALADTYLGQRSYPSPRGLWLHNSRVQVTGDTFGFGRNTTLMLLCANQGPNCDAGAQGSFWDFGYRKVYGQEDGGVFAVINTEQPPLVDHAPVAHFTGEAAGHYRATFKTALDPAVFAPRKVPPDGLFMHPQLVAMTSDCFMGYITDWDPSGHWVAVDNWSRGAGNSCGGAVRSGGLPDVPPGGAALSIGNVTSGVGLLYGVVNTADTTMSRGAEFGEFTLANNRTAEIKFSDTSPTGDEMDNGDGLGPKPFIDWGFMLGTGTSQHHRYAAGTAMLANGDWYRAFVSADPAGEAAFIDMPRGGGNNEGASFRSFRVNGDVLICSPSGRPISCKLDHAGNLQLAGKLLMGSAIELARLPQEAIGRGDDCTPGALAYQPGARNGNEAPGGGTGLPVFCNDRRVWVTMANGKVER